MRRRFDGGENLFLAFSGNGIGVDSKTCKNSFHEESASGGVSLAGIFHNNLLENAEAKKNGKAGGALPEIKIAKAAGQ